jgi:protein TonB
MRTKVFFSALCLLFLMSACTWDKKASAAQNGNEEEAHFKAEEMPEYPGGMSAMMTFISDNIKYPEDAKNAQVEGRVLCTFVIDKSGKVTDVKVVESSGVQSLDDEAVRVVSLMPDWKPGKDKGELVNVMFTIPIKFSLD